MPNRLILESCRASKSLRALSDTAERLWWRLVTCVDDYGRLEADPEVVLAEAFKRRPDGWTQETVTRALLELSQVRDEDEPLLHLYRVGTKTYLQVAKASLHIRCRATQSKYPAPEAIVNQACLPLTDSGAHPRASARNGTPMSADAGAGEHPPLLSENENECENGRGKEKRTDLCVGGFGSIWAIWPKKRSKGQAEKAWRTLNPNEQLQSRIVAAIEQAKTSEQWLREGGRFIPHLATWLRAKGWEDEQQPAVAEPARSLVDFVSRGMR
jgi:hypothetical protein